MESHHSFDTFWVFASFSEKQRAARTAHWSSKCQCVQVERDLYMLRVALPLQEMQAVDPGWTLSQLSFPPPKGREGWTEAAAMCRFSSSSAACLCPAARQGVQRHEADLEMLFCLHWGKKRELLCYSLVIKWLCFLGCVSEASTLQGK